jgi:hypothetical protein
MNSGKEFPSVFAALRRDKSAHFPCGIRIAGRGRFQKNNKSPAWNIEQPTSNTEHPMKHSLTTVF